MSRVTIALPPFRLWVQGQISLSKAFQALCAPLRTDEVDFSLRVDVFFSVYRLVVEAKTP